MCGRGIVKWQPFDRMPEQFEGISRLLEKQYKIPKPYLTDEAKERIERALQESLHQQKEIFISYYQNGFIHEEYITVISIDAYKKISNVYNAFNLNTRFQIDEFVDVK
ncbi:YolD-like family protein [Bacillus cereus]|nr:YolD-like family protein [Bacillus cereus]